MKRVIMCITLLVTMSISGCNRNDNSVNEYNNKTTAEDITESYEKEPDNKLSDKLLESNLPQIAYIDEEKVMLYDSENVYIYSLTDQEMIDIWNKGELGYNYIEGDMASSVSVSKDGKIVYVYYVDTPGYGCSYSVEEKKISEASNISDDFWYLDVISEGDNESNFLSLPSDLIQVGNIYVNDDKQYSVMIVDGITSYGDIYLGISDGIEFDKYKLFN